MIIFLIGPRGSGKTTTGQALAKRLDYAFIDLDEALLQELGETIEAFVNKNGWQAFRDRESACLEKTCKVSSEKSLVIATGGGVPLAEKNRLFLREMGTVVWLDVPADILEERLQANPLQSQRPSLTGKSLREEIGEILKEREPVYRSCHHFQVNAARHPAAVCEEILARLKK